MDSEGSISSLVNPTDAQIQNIIKNFPIIAYVYWNGAGDGRLMPELHGARMSPDTHAWLHDHIGSAYDSGMAMSNFVADGNGSSDTHAQFSIATGVMSDEDLDHTLAAISETVGAEIWYADANVWKWVTNTGFSVRNYQDNTANRLAYNSSAGGGTQVEVTDGRYVLCHIFATNVTADTWTLNDTTKFIAIQGQNEYSSLLDARAGADTEVNTLAFGNLPLQELIPVGTVIFQTRSSYTNAINARVRTTTGGDNYIDWRTTALKATGSSVIDHGNLAGLLDDDHPQYANLTARQNTFTDIVSAEAFYVQGDSGSSELSENGLVVPSGSAATPSITFSGDLDTGLYNTADAVGIATAGVFRLGVGSSVLSVGTPINSATGSASAPAYSYIGATDTGVYWEAADTLGFSAAGQRRAVIGRDGMRVEDKVEAEAFYVTGAGCLCPNGSGDLVISASGGKVVLSDAMEVDVSLSAAQRDAFTWDTVFTTGGGTSSFIDNSTEVTVDSIVFIYADLFNHATYKMAAAPTLQAFTLFNALPTIENAANVNLMSSITLNAGTTHSRTDSGTSVVTNNTGVQYIGKMKSTASGAIMTATNMTGLYMRPTYSTVAGSTVNLGTCRAVRCVAPNTATGDTSNGTENLTAYYGIDFENITFTSSGDKVVVRSAMTDATDRYFLQNNGGARSLFAGKIFMNDGVAVNFGTIGNNGVEALRSAAGTLRLIGSGGSNNEALEFDFETASNVVNVASSTGAALRISNRLDINNGTALGGGAAPTLGTIGGSGPTAAAQAQWVEIDINGTAHWIPVWV
jgi:hypothetical protein